VPKLPEVGPIRGVRTVRALYPKLAVAPDFAQTTLHWVDGETFDTLRFDRAPGMVAGFDGLPLLPSVRGAGQRARSSTRQSG